MTKGVQAFRPLAPRHVLERIALWQLACIFGAVGFVWACEFFDLQALICGASPSGIDWSGAGMLSAVIFTCGLAAVTPVHLYHKKRIGRSVTICSYCRKVQVAPDAWDQIEMFFARSAHATYSHGVCPDCCSKVMTAYRSGRKDAGAREPLPTEVLV